MAAILNHLRGVIIVAPWLVWLAFIDIAVSLLLPIKPLLPDGVYDLSSALASTVWLWIQLLFERANGARIVVSGDVLPPGESAIVVVNHVGWPDFYMVQHLAIQAGMLGRCRYFAKSSLRWVPFLGWGLWSLGMPLVSRRWLQDRAQLDRVFRGIVKRRWPIWLVSFSEATRFTPAKHAASSKWCAETGRPQPQHLLYPRTKGFVATVQHLRQAPHVAAVYDLAIAYQRDAEWQAAPDMWETMSAPLLSRPSWKGGRGYRFQVHVRRYPITSLPASDTELAEWLERRWVEKGEWLEETKIRWAADNGMQTEAKVVR